MMASRLQIGVFVCAIALALGTPADAQNNAAQPTQPPRTETRDKAAESHTPKAADDAAEPEHIRGQITGVEGSAVLIRTNAGKTVRVALTNNTTVISLSKGSFADIDFGTYVGAVAVKMEEYSPIVRDSAVWLHKAYELRIIDDQLRGIALGHKKWDFLPESIISHGWVDDIEIRVLSIKWGPTDYDETDVEVPRDVPINKMSLGDKSLLKAGARVFIGAQKNPDGRHQAQFVFVGKDGIVPPL